MTRTHPQGCQVYIHQTFGRRVVRHFRKKTVIINGKTAFFWFPSGGICVSHPRVIFFLIPLVLFSIQSAFFPPLCNPGQKLRRCYIPTYCRSLSLSLCQCVCLPCIWSPPSFSLSLYPHVSPSSLSAPFSLSLSRADALGRSETFWGPCTKWGSPPNESLN